MSLVFAFFPSEFSVFVLRTCAENCSAYETIRKSATVASKRANKIAFQLLSRSESGRVLSKEEFDDDG